MRRQIKKDFIQTKSERRTSSNNEELASPDIIHREFNTVEPNISSLEEQFNQSLRVEEGSGGIAWLQELNEFLYKLIGECLSLLRELCSLLNKEVFFI
jgi:hypothetical protein